MTETLWTPWRMAFIKKARKSRKGCIFCTLPQKGISSKTLVLSKGKTAFVILNRYPYTSGHLMVVPFRHVGDFEKLNSAEHGEMGELLSRSVLALKKTHHPQGFNIGVNLGDVAGTGIRGHVHYHVVPRWKGDSNFMPVTGKTRLIPEAIGDTYKKLARHFR